ncbi:MAG: peptidylprolyl isomerase [Chitinophagaceae bacterium]|nr:peptidylprolyl isomerase [Chitinophagaceae bacterium]
MKKFLLLLSFLFTVSVICSQTLFTYGPNAVSKDEFLRAYNKNKVAAGGDAGKAIREYLNLYINFKLKVKAAQDIRLDTLESQKNDLQNFRGEIQGTYLNDEAETEKLVNEAFIRSQKDIHVAYLFFSLADAGTDSNKIYQAAQNAYTDLLHNSTTTFSEEIQHPANQSVKAISADAGFITVFSLPYQFENIIYALHPGEISKPHLSKNGYSIFKNIEERKAVGKIKAAQILFALPPDADEVQRKNTKQTVDSVYSLLKQGADFAVLAKDFSNDKLTYMNGGALPEFGAGKYEPAFETKIFSLQKDGEISEPFLSPYGYHIIKRISLTPVSTNRTDPQAMYAIKQQVLQNERIGIAKQKFLITVLQRIGYKKNAAINETGLWNYTDSFVIANKSLTGSALNDKTILFSYNGQKITVGDWLQYAKAFRNSSESYKGSSYKKLMEKYISFTALEYYSKRLENYNPEYKYQLQEFKDGNLLFEVMERNVWSKASEDSTGLKSYYIQHKNQYNWMQSADAILVSAASEKLAQDAVQQLKKGRSWKQIMDESGSQIQVDSARYELTQIPVKDKSNLMEGTITLPVVNETDGTATFVKIIRLYQPNQPRNFEEARGLVVNDYQSYLEEKWLETIKLKYPVTINEKVFQSLVH